MLIDPISENPTTRELSVIRHAAAGPSERGDRDRPLSAGGQGEALWLGTILEKLDFEPDLFRTSDASRALQTARILTRAIGYSPDRLQVEPALYLASCESLLQAIRGTGIGVRHLVVVGHNPGLSELWDLLGDVREKGLPTCGMVRLRLDVGEWEKIGPGCAQLLDFIRPPRGSSS